MIIQIDGKPFDVADYYRRHGHDTLPEHPTMHGAAIAAEVGKSDRVWLEVDGPEQDIFVPMWAAVLLKPGMKFYVVGGYVGEPWPPQRIYGVNVP